MILLKLIIVLLLLMIIFNHSKETFNIKSFCPDDLIEADASNSYSNLSKGWCQTEDLTSNTILHGKTIDDVNNCYINQSEDGDSESSNLLGTNECSK